MVWDDLTPDDLPSAGEINSAIAADALPTGPTPILSSGQADPAPGATINATWTNPGGTSGLNPEIQWYRNGNPDTNQVLPPGATGASLSTAGWASGDTATARVRYHAPSGRLVGSPIGGPPDDLVDNATLNAALVLAAPLSPASDIASSGEIMAARAQWGEPGSISNPITLW